MSIGSVRRVEWLIETVCFSLHRMASKGRKKKELPYAYFKLFELTQEWYCHAGTSEVTKEECKEKGIWKGTKATGSVLVLDGSEFGLQTWRSVESFEIHSQNPA